MEEETVELDDGNYDEGFDDLDFGVNSSDEEREDGAVEERLRRIFRASFRHQWGDVVAEDKQPILYEGSSFINTILCSNLLSWEHGPQIPTLLFLAETVLRRLKRNGWDVVFVFFDVLQAQSWASPAHQLAAQVLENHIKQVVTRSHYDEDVGAASAADRPAVSVFEFPNWRTSKFIAFLRDTHPAFIVVDPPTDSDEEAESSLYDLQRIFILDQLHNRHRCITSDFEFHDLRVCTFSLLETNRLTKYYNPEQYSSSIVSQEEAAASAVAHFEDEVNEKLKTLLAEGDAYSIAPVVATCCRLLADASLTPEIVKVYLLHSLMLRSIDLNQRAVKSELVEDCSGAIPTLITKLNETISVANSANKGIYLDVLDGRFFTALSKVLSSTAVTSAEDAGLQESGFDAVDLWNAITSIAGVDSSSFYPVSAPSATCCTEAKPAENNEGECIMSQKMFVNLSSAFDSELTKEVTSDLKKRGLTCDEDESQEILMAPELQKYFKFRFDNPLAENRVTKSETMNARQKRSHMKNYAFMKKFAETLTSKLVVKNIVTARSDGCALKSLTATADDDVEEEEETNKKKKKGGNKKGARGGKGGKKSNKAEEIKKANKIRLSKADVEKVNAAIETAGKEKDIKDKIQKLADRMRVLKKQNSAPMALVHGYIHLAEWCVEHWDEIREEARQEGREPKNFKPAVNAIRIVYDVLDFYVDDVDPPQMKIIQKVLIQLGFTRAARELYKRYVGIKGQAVKKIAVFNPNKEDYDDVNLGMSFQRFQLCHAGHLMQRSFDSCADKRASGFHPDAWQRKLMDAVDLKQCALVVAPTSSGKTFVSYYTMKQVLDNNKVKVVRQSRRRDTPKTEKKSNYGVVAYVCPTKALVNQVGAEIYARYGPVVGVLTREYSQNINNCQVLVTVPTMLEQILLTPEWAPLLQYCILDEVHCIQGNDTATDAETGAVWEHIIDLLQCPFVALSATIGNPDHFHAWLQQTQRPFDRDVALIVHKYRWGDLKLSVYSPPDTEKDRRRRLEFVSTNTTPRKTALRILHPMACISVSDILNVGALNVISLSPDECVVLYDTLYEQYNIMQRRSEFEEVMEKAEPIVGTAFKTLNPEKYFLASQIILRYDVYQYEGELKDLVSRLCNEGCGIIIERVIHVLAGETLDDEEETNDGPITYPCGNKFTNEYIVPLLTELMSMGRLPALLFSLNRRLCMRLAIMIIELLQKTEAEDRTRPEFQKRIREIERLNKRLQKEAKRKRDNDEDEKNPSNPFGGEEATVLSSPDEGPDPKFSFIPPNKRMYTDDRKYWEDRIKWKVNCNDPIMATLLEGLDRGVAVHHAGLPRQYRLAVEVMFRAGHLQVVFATGTLALGINMPARTVCFIEDTAGLTPLLYQQMSGRAGRRGYDDVGYVVFCGMPKHKVHSLVSSKLTTVTGFQPISTSLTLRSVISFDAMVDTQKHLAAQYFKGLLQPPLYTSNIADAERRQLHVRHVNIMFRVYLEMLRRYRLIDSSINPIGLAGLAAALQPQEPANFLMCYLLSSGIFDGICAPFHADREGTARKLLLVLCHIFNHSPLPRDVVPPPQGEHSSIVVLPPLDDEIKEHIDRFEQLTMRTFVECLVGASNVSQTEGDCSLPISGVSFAKSGPASAILKQISYLKESQLRSPFFGIAGHGDHFSTPREFATSAISGLLVDASQVPLDVLLDSSGKRMRLNAVALDYYCLVDKSLLVRDNGFKEEVAWELMSSWNALLQAIHNNLSMMISNAKDSPTVNAFKYLSEEFEKKFQRFNEPKNV